MASAKRQDFELHKGDSKSLVVTVKDKDGLVVNITGASVAWKAAENSVATADISKATGGSGITLSDAVNGEFTVTIDPADTSSLDPGDYYHEAEVTDASGLVATVTVGTMTLLEDLV